DQSGGGGGSNEQGRWYVPPEQHEASQRRDADGEPIANRQSREYNARAEDRADGRGTDRPDEPLHVGVLSIPHEQRRSKRNEQKRWQKDPYRRDDTTNDTAHDVADERRGNHDRPRRNHADRDGDHEITLTQPMLL